MPGMHGTVPSVLALQESDLLIALGARFDDRVTGKVSEFAPHAKVIHVDIDPAEIGKIRAADVPIVGDAREVLLDLLPAYRDAAKAQKPDFADWWKRLESLRTEFPLGYTLPDDGLLSPQWVIEKIGELSGPEAVYAAGVGQHQMWAAQFIKYERPGAWLNSGGAGTMGYAVPAAMGAKVAQPERLVWAIDGDGCFQMTNQELATCTINEIPIKVAIINNSSLGMVRQWQTLFYDGRHSFTDLNTGHDTAMIPDFLKMADAYGALGIRVTKPDEVEPAIKLAMETNDRPVVIDFIVSRDAMVWPMVPQGVGNSQVQYARDHAPEWERE
jgi:acetolactate synthase-1/2/3 large subunit